MNTKPILPDPEITSVNTFAKVPVGGSGLQTYGFSPGLISFFSCRPRQTQCWEILIFQQLEQKFTASPEPFNILFQSNQGVSDSIKSAQRATLVVKMDNNCNDQQFWQFAGKGVVYTKDIKDINCRVSTELQDNDTTLVITIDRVVPFKSESGANAFCVIPFRLAATCVDEKSEAQGSTPIYYSQDPSIGVGEEIGN